MQNDRQQDTKNLKEIAAVFLKLGIFGFGGPATHIAMMEEEVVAKRRWLEPQHFLDLMGATNLIPGPNSTEMTMHCGYERGGWRGLFVAGACFILPAVIITSGFAWLYQQYGKLPEVEPYLYGIKPAVIAIIISAVYKLGKKAVKSTVLAFLALLTFGVCLGGFSEVLAMFGTGILGLLLYYANKVKKDRMISLSPLLFLHGFYLALSNSKTFLIFLKIGALLYGGGYVLFAFLDDTLISTGLLSRQELMDAIAVGQFTPGPILSTATFVGWQLGGLGGAAAATIGIFLPSFLFVWLLNPMVSKLRKSAPLGVLLDSINVAAVAVIAAVCVDMGRDSLYDWRTITIMILSLVLSFGFRKVNSAFIVLGGAVLGYLLSLV